MFNKNYTSVGLKLNSEPLIIISMINEISPKRITPVELTLEEGCDYSAASKPKTAATKEFHNFKLLKSGIDVVPLLAAIEEQPELWEEITQRQEIEGSPHKYTRSIFLRWSPDKSLEAAFKDLKCMNYPALHKLPEAIKLMEQVWNTVGAADVGRVLIVELEPGGFIAPHADEGDYADHFERFHISLQSSVGNMFSVESSSGCGEFVHMQAGEMWFFNHKGVHYLYNGSDKPRIHLIVDCVAPKFKMERA